MGVTGQLRFVIISLGLLCLIVGTEQAKWRDQHAFEAPAITGPLLNFTCKLFSSLTKGAKSNESDNIIVSPISLHKALNMVLLGTDEGTETEHELLDTLSYKRSKAQDLLKYHEDYARLLAEFKQLKAKALARIKGKGESDRKKEIKGSYERPQPFPPVLDLFNMVITKNDADLLPEYVEKVANYYNSSVENVDDEEPETKTKVMKQLNSWGKGAGFDSPIMTKDELDDDFVAILLSAISVQASWTSEFMETKGKAVFYNHGLKDSPVKGSELGQLFRGGAKFLNLTAERPADRSPDHDLGRLNAQVVQVPLDGGLSFIMFEPHGHSKPGDNKLKKLAKRLFGRKGMTLQRVLKKLDAERRSEVYLKMPKFKFEKELDIVEVLKSMGLKKAFEKREAEIRHIIDGRVFINKAKHQAMIDVNEKGIKAAGVTKITVSADSAPLPIAVTIDKPFVFLLRYGEIPLFVGQLSTL